MAALPTHAITQLTFMVMQTTCQLVRRWWWPRSGAGGGLGKDTICRLRPVGFRFSAAAAEALNGSGWGKVPGSL